MGIFLLIVFIVLVFAVYGFICFCIWIANQTDSPPQPTKPIDLPEGTSHQEIADVRGAERLLNHFYLTNKIDDAQYNRIRDILEKDYKEYLLHKTRLQKTESQRSLRKTC